MLEVYGLNVTTPVDGSIVFNNTSIKKGCTAELSGVSTILLNKCGVYMIEFNGSSAAAVTVQLFKNGVAQPQAQATGTSPSFVTLVQVPESNTNCPCSSPTDIQIVNVGDASATFTDVNVVVTKVV